MALEYFSRPIVGAWKCEVTAMPEEAVFRALGDTLSRASAEADCVAAVLLHYIIGYHILTLGCHKQLTKNEENNFKYS